MNGPVDTAAHQLGLVTQLGELESLDSILLNYAARLGALAPLAVRETKRVLGHIAASASHSGHTDFDDARRRITRQ